MKIWKASEIDLACLRRATVAVIGYGSQGEAQALNLRDSGFTPLVGLRRRSPHREKAIANGFNVVTPTQAVQQADVVAILIPDHCQEDLFAKTIGSWVRPGQTFVFAHALAVHFGLIKQPAGVDFVLVAPHGPGLRLRQCFLSGTGIPAFVAKTKQSRPAAWKVALAYGKAIGCARAGLIRTTFANEAIGDIFGEQAVLCGGLAALVKAGFRTLVNGGLPPSNAYLECVHQLDLIVDLIKEYGVDGMYERISATARYGSVMAEPKIINARSRQAMRLLLRSIKDGGFVKQLCAEKKRSFSRLKKRKRRLAEPALDTLARFFAKKFPN